MNQGESGIATATHVSGNIIDLKSAGMTSGATKEDGIHTGGMICRSIVAEKMATGAVRGLMTEEMTGMAKRSTKTATNGTRAHGRIETCMTETSTVWETGISCQHRHPQFVITL